MSTEEIPSQLHQSADFQDTCFSHASVHHVLFQLVGRLKRQLIKDLWIGYLLIVDADAIEALRLLVALEELVAHSTHPSLTVLIRICLAVFRVGRGRILNEKNSVCLN